VLGRFEPFDVQVFWGERTEKKTGRNTQMLDDLDVTP
jgi:hypothetical protein